MEVPARYNQVFIGEDGGIVGDRVDLGQQNGRGMANGIFGSAVYLGNTTE